MSARPGLVVSKRLTGKTKEIGLRHSAQAAVYCDIDALQPSAVRTGEKDDNMENFRLDLTDPQRTELRTGCWLSGGSEAEIVLSTAMCSVSRKVCIGVLPEQYLPD